jgi:hypothetical protein
MATAPPRRKRRRSMAGRFGRESALKGCLRDPEHACLGLQLRERGARDAAAINSSFHRRFHFFNCFSRAIAPLTSGKDANLIRCCRTSAMLFAKLDVQIETAKAAEIVDAGRC